MTIYRRLEVERDFPDIVKLWHEIGWLDSNKVEDHDGLKLFFQAGAGWVFTENDRVEATTLAVPGQINYLDKQLAFHGLSGVVVSPVVRKRGVARELVSRSLVDGQKSGHVVSGLWMFEQGFYNSLGYGTGSYDHHFTFDPALLKIDVDPRPPVRFGKEDWEKIHKALLARKKVHGGVSLSSSLMTQEHLKWTEDKGYGLGYYDEQGEISHMFWLQREQGNSHGPLRIDFLIYKDNRQFIELMGLLKNFGDQVYAVKLEEPADIQLQDFFKKPHKQKNTGNDKYGFSAKARASWQARIIDLEEAVKVAAFSSSTLKFNLDLTDPLDNIGEDKGWQKISGQYIIELGPKSKVELGHDSNLPTLRSTVNALTRLWLGVLSPSGLALSEDFQASETLMSELEDYFSSLPKPKFQWGF
ncbi:MAG: GNAT family N-acetyltransferase [Bacillota bacterium]